MTRTEVPSSSHFFFWHPFSLLTYPCFIPAAIRCLDFIQIRQPRQREIVKSQCQANQPQPSPLLNTSRLSPIDLFFYTHCLSVINNRLLFSLISTTCAYHNYNTFFKYLQLVQTSSWDTQSTANAIRHHV